MRLKNKSTIGDLYAVPLAPSEFAVMQFAGVDRTQLSTDVVLVYRPRLMNLDTIDGLVLSASDIEFYTHTKIKVGVKVGKWFKVGSKPLPFGLKLIFRCTDEFGPDVRVSDQWYLWELNGAYQVVGRLNSEAAKAELGVVIMPSAVVERIQTGRFAEGYAS